MRRKDRSWHGKYRSNRRIDRSSQIKDRLAKRKNRSNRKMSRSDKRKDRSAREIRRSNWGMDRSDVGTKRFEGKKWKSDAAMNRLEQRLDRSKKGCDRKKEIRTRFIPMSARSLATRSKASARSDLEVRRAGEMDLKFDGAMGGEGRSSGKPGGSSPVSGRGFY